MTSIRLTSSLLWLLLACILFKYSIAHAHQVAAPVGYISVNQELSNDVVVGASLRDSWIKGRKMLVERKEEMMKEKGVNGGSSEISGKAKTASGKLFGISKDGRNVQVSKILKPKTSDSINMETNGSNSHSPEEHHPRTLQTPEVSKAPLVDSNLQEPSRSEVAASQELHEVFHEVESQRLLEDAIEAMGMLNMDYNNPHRKPPISNGHPANEEKN